MTFVLSQTGAERFSRDVELMTGRPVPILIRFCWCFVTPTALLVGHILMVDGKIIEK